MPYLSALEVYAHDKALYKSTFTLPYISSVLTQLGMVTVATAMVSLGLVSPGVATDGFIPIFS